MRIVASIALLAGCDVLFQLRPVTNRDAADDMQIDAPEPDARPEPPALCTPSPWTVNSLGPGSFYTVDENLTKAVFQSAQRLYETTPGSTAQTKQLFADMTGLRSPRLSPAGTELFMLSDTPCCAIVVSKLQPDGTWAPPEAITLTNHTVSSTELPGAPSAGRGAKRRMIISDQANDELFEMREDPEGWTQVSQYLDQQLGVAAIQDANLSPDGYRMFFAGRLVAGDSERAFMVDRTDLTARFEAANVIELHNSMQAAEPLRSPYVSSDCTRLFFSLGNGGQGSTVRQGTP